MKSILAKHSPQSRPWLKMRLRQAIQTGGRRRSASRPSHGHTIAAKSAPGGTDGAFRPSSASPVGMVTKAYKQMHAGTITGIVIRKSALRDADRALRISTR